MKKTNGITLVALVVTIIVLLILAGITISQLTGSGLFEKAILAKQKADEAQEKESSLLNEYGKIIKEGSRDTITISKSELKDLIQEEIQNAKGVPAGTIISYMGNNAPEGYIFCDGAEYNISDYPDLAEQIKAEFGSYNYYGGNGTTTFAVPNLQGEFLRGYSTNQSNSKVSGIKTAAVGIHQDGTNHNQLIASSGSLWIGVPLKSSTTDSAPSNMDLNNTKAEGVLHTNGTDTAFYNTNSWAKAYATTYTSRPTNTSVLYCIKY